MISVASGFFSRGIFVSKPGTRLVKMLPKDVREQLKLMPGCKVEGSIDEKGRLVLVPALHEPEALFLDRPPVERVVSVEEMNRAIGRKMHTKDEQ
jgi:bifunctional DNA-binding transcriptional regulator/antitoxin component of YhaV-PrlF toxin-antitoxin module